MKIKDIFDGCLDYEKMTSKELINLIEELHKVPTENIIEYSVDTEPTENDPYCEENEWELDDIKERISNLNKFLNFCYDKRDARLEDNVSWYVLKLIDDAKAENFDYYSRIIKGCKKIIDKLTNLYPKKPKEIPNDIWHYGYTHLSLNEAEKKFNERETKG